MNRLVLQRLLVQLEIRDMEDLVQNTVPSTDCSGNLLGTK